MESDGLPPSERAPAVRRRRARAAWAVAVAVAVAGVSLIGVQPRAADAAPPTEAIPPPGTPPLPEYAYSAARMMGPGLVDEPRTSTSPSVGALPVNLATGNLWLTKTDLAVPGRGVAAALGRTYNSGIMSLGGLFGPGWTSSLPFMRSNGFSFQPELVDEHGNVLHFSRDPGGKSFSGALGQRIVIAPDGKWVLTRHDQTTLTFNPAPWSLPQVGGELLSMKDENGAGITISWSGKVPTAITDTAGRKLTITAAGDRVAKVSDAAGRSVGYAYDSAGHLVAVTDPVGAVTRYGYDAEHKLISVKSPRGHTTRVTYAYLNYAIQATSQTDALGNVTKYDYVTNPDAKPLMGCPNKVVRVTSGGGVLRTYTFAQCAMVQRVVGTSGWSYSYDPQLRGISKIVDPNLHTIEQTFDAYGNVATAKDALGRVTRSTYSPTNKVLTTTDPLGRVATRTYDAKGNLTKVSQGDLTTTHTYGDADHPGDRTSTTDPAGKVWTYTYNAHGMLASSRDPLGNTGRSSYDAVGRRVSSTAPSGAVTAYTLDAAGRVTAVTDPLHRVTRTEYDAGGNVTKLTEATGAVTTTAYDALDRPTATTVAVGTPSARTTKTAYGADGQVLTQTDGLGHATTYRYDAAGRLAGVTDPLRRSKSLTYDAASNVATTVDAAGRTTTYGYDAMDRLVTTRYSDGTKGITSTTFDAAGRRTAMTDGTGTISYAYDDHDRLISRKDGAGATVGYAYDKRGLITTLTYPGGVNKVVRGYDDAGRMTSVRDWLGNTSRFSYDANSNLTTTTLGNGDVIRSAFDATDRATVLSLSDGSTVLKRLGYTRDAAGMVSAEDATAYTYDPTHRLASAGGTAFGYDAADRRIKTGGTTLSYDDGDQLLSKVTGDDSTTYTYDKHGNRSKRTSASGVTSYSFDQAGRMTGLDNTGYGHHTFAYDGDGLRVSKHIGGPDQTQKYTWNVGEGLPTILTDFGFSYVTGPGGLPLAQIAGTTALYYFHDQLGSTRVLTNQDGSVNTTYEYTADGALKSRTGTANNPFQFAGQYWDSTTGLYHLRARYYDPGTAQFISRDPAVSMTRQPYGYANNNPVNLTDPSGLYVPGVNGCGSSGGVKFPEFSFGSACNRHDFCYGAGVSRGTCDSQFRDNARASCSWGSLFCRMGADWYHGAIEKFGQDAYDKAQLEGPADLARQLAACGGNTGCIETAQNQAEFDKVMNQMQGCGSNTQCEQDVADQYHNTDGTDDTIDGVENSDDWSDWGDSEWDDSEWGDSDWGWDDSDWGGGGGPDEIWDSLPTPE
ncbi:RHS repeat-associated core domain-containing protein [Actinoplanes sp. NPDC051346]|uniref:RHS repeat-associated core domain-containing protein n=1 Tax=Actinoplanes sp. NPDC051346 TaxID=3155048 RepID=UPI00342E71CD